MKSSAFDEVRPFFLVFDRGDEIVETLREFAVEKGIRGGRFAAIGAVAAGVVAYWNRETREYDRIEVEEQVEVLSLVGDIAVEGDETRIHAHAVLGRRDGSTIGGHLLEGTVYPTLEMHLVDYGATLERKKDDETLLSLIEM